MLSTQGHNFPILLFTRVVNILDAKYLEVLRYVLTPAPCLLLLLWLRAFHSVLQLLHLCPWIYKDHQTGLTSATFHWNLSSCP